MGDVNEKVDALPGEDSSRRAKQPEAQSPKKKNTKNNAIFVIVIILAVAFLGRDNIAEMFPEEIPDVVLNPADVQMYTFSDPFDNDSINVEFWLINIGEETGTEIEVFIRARDQNGTILFSEIVDTTTLLLRDNETCSGWYTVPIDESVEYVTHTIELSWDVGRNSYSRKTNL